MRIFVLNILIYYTFSLHLLQNMSKFKFFNFPNLQMQYYNYISKDFIFWSFYHFLLFFSKLKWRYTEGGVEFENCPIVSVCVSNWDYRLDPFSAGSWHEPVLKVPFSNSTPPCGSPFQFCKKQKKMIKTSKIKILRDVLMLLHLLVRKI